MKRIVDIVAAVARHFWAWVVRMWHRLMGHDASTQSSPATTPESYTPTADRTTEQTSVKAPFERRHWSSSDRDQPQRELTVQESTRAEATTPKPQGPVSPKATSTSGKAKAPSAGGSGGEPTKQHSDKLAAGTSGGQSAPQPMRTAPRKSSRSTPSTTDRSTIQRNDQSASRRPDYKPSIPIEEQPEGGDDYER